MKNGLRVIDSDMHVIEPRDLWLRYLPAELRGRAPVGPANAPTQRNFHVNMPIDGDPPVRSGVDTLPTQWWPSLHAHMVDYEPEYEFAESVEFNAASQVDAMNREGIDIAVLFPSRGLMVMGHDLPHNGTRGLEPGLAAGIARAYNDWLAEFCGEDRARLFGAAMVAPHDVDSAVAETRRCVEQFDFRAIFLLPGIVGGRPWHHPDYDPLWAVCQELDVAVCFHGGGPDDLTDFAAGHRSMLMMWHTLSHCVGPMGAVLSFCGGGVFDRFPSLRAGFLEANCSWAPWLLHRLDEHYDEYVGRFEIKLGRKPSEYFVTNCYVSVEADEAPATLYVQTYGNDNVVFSTDYPHPDAKFPHAVDAFLAGQLDDDSKRKILWDNCARLYRIG